MPRTTIPIEAVVIIAGTPIPDAGYQAWLFVTGDPVAALRSLAAQARTAGMRVGGVVCTMTEREFATCSFVGEHEDAGRTRWVDARLWRGQDKALASPFSHIVLEYHDHRALDFDVDDIDLDAPVARRAGNARRCAIRRWMLGDLQGGARGRQRRDACHARVQPPDRGAHVERKPRSRSRTPRRGCTLLVFNQSAGASRTSGTS